MTNVGKQTKPIITILKVSFIGGLFGFIEASLVASFDPEITLNISGFLLFSALSILMAAIYCGIFATLFVAGRHIIRIILKEKAVRIVGKTPHPLAIAITAGVLFFGLFYLNETILPGKTHPISLFTDGIILIIALVILRFGYILRIPKKTEAALSSVVILTTCAVYLIFGGVFAGNNTNYLSEDVPISLDNANRNLLFITIDTTRTDKLGCYGNSDGLTPNLDRLANDGVMFDRAYTPQPITGPAHTSLFTGLRPREAGVIQNGVPVPQNLDTMAERLSSVGYDTGAAIAAFVVSSRMDFDQGFSYYDDSFNPLASITRISFVRVAGIAGLVETKAKIQRRGDEVSDKAIKWLSKRDEETPFFLWLHYFDPHTPYEPPADWVDSGNSEVKEIKAYEGEIAFMDNEIGRVISYLKDIGLADNTVIVIVADHGESLGEHDYYWDHGRYLYDTETRVPLIIAGPGVPSGIISSDVFETHHIGDLVYPLLSDTLWDDAYLPFADNSSAYGEAIEDGEYRSMWVKKTEKDGEFTLHKRINEGTGDSELYNLIIDPDEIEDISDTNTDIHSKLGKELRNIEKSQPPFPEEMELDESTKEKLRELGYLN